MRAPLAPPRLSVPRNVDADAQAVETSWEMDSPEARILRLEGGDVLRADQLVGDRRDGVLPQLRLRGHQRAEVPARCGPMSRCVSLNHALAKASANSSRVLEEAPRDLLVGRVEPQREVGGQHGRRVTLRRVVGVGTVPAPMPCFGIHWCAPAGLLVSSHS